MESIETKVQQQLSALPLPVPPEEHQKNASAAASAAVDWRDYQYWLNAGADEEDPQEPEVIAISMLPAQFFDMLGVIAAASDGHSVGQLQAPRADFAATLSPPPLRELLVRLAVLMDVVDEGDDETDLRGPALRPMPRTLSSRPAP